MVNATSRAVSRKIRQTPHTSLRTGNPDIYVGRSSFVRLIARSLLVRTDVGQTIDSPY